MIIDCIADLHGHSPHLEGGDLLIIAGDLTARSVFCEYIYFVQWMMSLNYEKIVVVAGNHDYFLVDAKLFRKKWIDKIDYLCDSGCEFRNVKIWGSPWTKTFPRMNPEYKAFTCDTEDELAEKWKLIPDDTEILVTHSPPYGMRDGRNAEQRLGSTSLLRKCVSSKLFNSIKLHAFGHIHEGYGKLDLREIQKKINYPITCVYVNASHVDKYYAPVNAPIRIILPED